MLNKFKLPDWFFFFLLIFLTITFFKLTFNFIIDVFLAALLAQLFYGFFDFLQKRFKFSPPAASIASIILAIFLVIIPIIGAGFLISKEAANVYWLVKQQWPQVQTFFSLEHLSKLQDRYPLVTDVLDIIKKLEFQKQMNVFLSKGADIMLVVLQKSVIEISLVLIHIIVTLFLMFFLLLDGKRLIRRIFYLAPLYKKDKQELFDEVVKIIDATIIGILVVGVVEGIFGGTLFAIFGIPSPVFWGLAMMVASIIPILGIHSIVFPAGIILIALGSPIKGILLLTLPHLGTTLTQHYMKPYLIGKKGGVHPAFILLSMLGGLAWFGIIGFLVGPIIAALFIAIWNQFGRHYKKELEEWNAKVDA